jgi:predicted ester cyclase
MYVRVTAVQGDAAAIDDVVELVRERVQPRVAADEGSRGVAVFADRENGRVVATTAWISEQARAASNVGLAPLRAEAERLMNGTLRVREWEVAVNDTAVELTAGCWMRSTAIEGDPTQLRDGIRDYQAKVIPALRGVAGFCGAVLVIDRSSGRAIGSTMWDSRGSLEASRAAATGLRTNVAAATGVRVTAVSEYEVVLAGLEPPAHEHLFRRAYETMSVGDLDDLDEFLAEGFVEHAPVPPGIPAGRAGVKELIGQYRQAFPDLRMTIEKYIEQGDTGCAVLRVTGTHTGPLFGQPATGRAIDITVIDVARVLEGRAVEHWGAGDDLGMLTQLGLAAAPADVSIPAQQGSSIDLESKVEA